MSCVVFAASEVGSARAILPICALCYEKKIPFVVTDRKYLGKEAEPSWNALRSCPDSAEGMHQFLLASDASALIFSINIKDTFPLKLARVANSMGVLTIHVLDYWNAYVSRMCMDGGNVFSPSHYIVQDEMSKQAAIKEGIDSEIINVFGQPAFADTIVNFEKTTRKSQVNQLDFLSNDKSKRVIVFVSEPVEKDHGSSEKNSVNFKGYTERVVLPLFCEAICSFSNDFEVCVLPHPRENYEQLNALWVKQGGDRVGQVIPDIKGRELLPFVDGIVGMSSTLLYEAWMIGIPVLSMQPNLRIESLRMMEGREGVLFLDDERVLVDRAKQWLLRIREFRRSKKLRKEAYLHKNASERILRLVNNIRL